jgi:hypothetical protein
MRPVLCHTVVSRPSQTIVLLLTLICCDTVRPAMLEVSTPVVEVEESVYSYVPARNGADPLWDFGSTNLVRVGERIFASGLETLPGVAPPNNTRCILWERDSNGWTVARSDSSGRTREPCPLTVLPREGNVFLSANPTVRAQDRAGGSLTKPVVLKFLADDARRSPVVTQPLWQDAPEQLQ